MIQFAIAVGYYYLLCWVDRILLAPLFGYQGLTYRSASARTGMCILGLILLCTAVTPVRYRQPSDGVLHILLPLVVVPVLVIASTDVIFADVSTGMIISITGAYLLLAACSAFPRPRVKPAGPLSPRHPWAVALLLTATSYGLMFATFGVKFRLLAFGDVYSVRQLFAEQVSGPLSYLLGWQANVINPVFIVYGARTRRRLPLITGLAGDFLIYTTTGFKSVLFSVLAIMGIMLALRQKKSAAEPPAIGVRLGFAFTLLVGAAYTLDAISHSYVWSSLFVRRMSLVAGVNTGYYFQLFSSAPKVHLSYGLIGSVLGRTGVVPPPQQVAVAAYHTTVGVPNANMWADAYANFGYAGIAAFTLVLAALLWLYDRTACHADRTAATVLITVPALTLANSALFTCVFTHGLLLALLVIALWPRIVQRAQEAASDRQAALLPQSQG